MGYGRLAIARDRATDMKKNARTPWQTKEWGIPPEKEAALVCHREAVVDMYKNPDHAQDPQVHMDAMATQRMGEVREPLPMHPGKPLKDDTAYTRNGPANICMAFAPFPGQRLPTVTDQRPKMDWAHFLRVSA
jgi:hypothetical protein